MYAVFIVMCRIWNSFYVYCDRENVISHFILSHLLDNHKMWWLFRISFMTQYDIKRRKIRYKNLTAIGKYSIIVNINNARLYDTLKWSECVSWALSFSLRQWIEIKYVYNNSIEYTCSAFAFNQNVIFLSLSQGYNRFIFTKKRIDIFGFWYSLKRLLLYYRILLTRKYSIK